jgi:coenzyme F420-0:L-glutamate ligase/coenzyme F420-1:gamma-L-glutamate ligase
MTQPSGLAVLPVAGIGEVRPGDDLAALIAGAAPWLADGDVLVVTSKVVSKAEGRLVSVPTEGPEREAARSAVLASETARAVARRGHTRIVQTHHGYVMASAGIDASNVDRGHLVLLPVDPDASARALRAELRDRYGLDVAVVVSDTMGRPWRTGLTDVALGAAGIDALRDYRGATDAHGNELHLTQMAVVDELSAAAELVMGKYDQVPVAVVRGLGRVGGPDGAGARVLVRTAEHDLFSMGTAEAVAAGLLDAARLSDVDGVDEVPADPAAVRRALDVVGSPDLRPVDDAVRDKVLADRPAYRAAQLVLATAPPDPVAAARVGADVHRLRAALLTEGLVSAWLPAEPVDLLPLPPGAVPVALLATGLPATSGAGHPGP